jgi:hypothetical protein
MRDRNWVALGGGKLSCLHGFKRALELLVRLAEPVAEYSSTPTGATGRTALFSRGWFASRLFWKHKGGDFVSQITDYSEVQSCGR